MFGQHSENNSYQTRYDKVKLAQWEEIIDKTPVYLKGAKFFIMKS